MKNLETKLELTTKENSFKNDIVPAGQQLVALLGLTVNEYNIDSILATPFWMTNSPEICSIQGVLGRLLQIYTTHAKSFSLNAPKLAQEVIPIDFMRENNFFYEQNLGQECSYIIPYEINETTSFLTLLETIVRWKQNTHLPHFAPIGVALLLNILHLFVIADNKYRDKMADLLRIWIYRPPAEIIRNTYYLNVQTRRGEIK